MDIKAKSNGNELTVALFGRLDTTTSPMLEKELKDRFDGLERLSFDFSDLEYLSSAGLRVLLACQKKMNAVNGSMEIRHANSTIQEIFDITGMGSAFTILE